eukprot:TRINITY_DN15537_c0_g1_i5.p1 TRINITY_DN15537_c0_g1~~TRINITY_DN15537_c0_g1_i5.p1  ORF type:complete len:775 (+),score=77.52 TRINITY_DN15537_c0_g1_i5:101-2425(+)
MALYCAFIQEVERYLDSSTRLFREVLLGQEHQPGDAALLPPHVAAGQALQDEKAGSLLDAIRVGPGRGVSLRDTISQLFNNYMEVVMRDVLKYVGKSRERAHALRQYEIQTDFEKRLADRLVAEKPRLLLEREKEHARKCRDFHTQLCHLRLICDELESRLAEETASKTATPATKPAAQPSGPERAGGSSPAPLGKPRPPPPLWRQVALFTPAAQGGDPAAAAAVLAAPGAEAPQPPPPEGPLWFAACAADGVDALFSEPQLASHAPWVINTLNHCASECARQFEAVAYYPYAGCAFLVAFQAPHLAADWAHELHLKLGQVSWPEALQKHPLFSKERAGADGDAPQPAPAAAAPLAGAVAKRPSSKAEAVARIVEMALETRLAELESPTGCRTMSELSDFCDDAPVSAARPEEKEENAAPVGAPAPARSPTPRVARPRFPRSRSRSASRVRKAARVESPSPRPPRKRSRSRTPPKAPLKLLRGQVKMWHQTKGFGIIRADGEQFFVHCSSIRRDHHTVQRFGGGKTHLAVGDCVIFVPAAHEKGPRAEQVRVTEPAPVPAPVSFTRTNDPTTVNKIPPAPEAATAPSPPRPPTLTVPGSPQAQAGRGTSHSDVHPGSLGITVAAGAQRVVKAAAPEAAPPIQGGADSEPSVQRSETAGGPFVARPSLRSDSGPPVPVSVRFPDLPPGGGNALAHVQWDPRDPRGRVGDPLLDGILHISDATDLLHRSGGLMANSEWKIQKTLQAEWAVRTDLPPPKFLSGRERWSPSEPPPSLR